MVFVPAQINSRFIISEKAFLQYKVINEGTGEVDLFHTQVPPNHRGKGIAKLLAKVGKNVNLK